MKKYKIKLYYYHEEIIEAVEKKSVQEYVQQHMQKVMPQETLKKIKEVKECRKTKE